MRVTQQAFTSYSEASWCIQCHAVYKGVSHSLVIFWQAVSANPGWKGRAFELYRLLLLRNETEMSVCRSCRWWTMFVRAAWHSGLLQFHTRSFEKTNALTTVLVCLICPSIMCWDSWEYTPCIDAFVYICLTYLWFFNGSVVGVTSRKEPPDLQIIWSVAMW